MFQEVFAKSLWLFLLLVLWLPALQSKKAGWWITGFACAIYGALIWIACWMIFSLPQPMTDIYPGSNMFDESRYDVISYDDHRIVAEKDSSNSNRKVEFISLHDGKRIAEYRLKIYPDFGNGTTSEASSENTEAYLYRYSGNMLIAVRGNKVLFSERVDTAQTALSFLQYDESLKKFIVTTHYYDYRLPNFNSIRVTKYDENFDHQEDKIFYVNRDALNSEVSHRGHVFNLEGLFSKHDTLYAYSDFENVIISLKEKGNDSLELDQIIPDSSIAYLNLARLIYKPDTIAGTMTSKGFIPWHIMSEWVKDTMFGIRSFFKQNKFNHGIIFPDYCGKIKTSDSIEMYENVMGKYAVSYTSYGHNGREFAYDGPAIDYDPSSGWIINARDTAKKTGMRFILHEYTDQMDLFLSGDTLVVFSDKMKKMARFNLANGERLDKQSWKSRIFERIYFYRSDRAYWYNCMIAFAYFFIPLFFLLRFASRIILKKEFFPWFNLQRAMTLYFIIALIILIQMSERIWQHY